MDTKKVQELLQTIQNAEGKLAELERERKAMDERIEAQRELALQLKRELAGELRDVLEPAGKPRAAGAVAGNKRSSNKGVSAVLLDALENGQARTTAELRHAIESKGLDATNVSLALAYLAKKGSIRRTGRGEYTKV